ncbi:MAG: dihydroneopterin aldolase [Sphingobacteriales bacterium]|nr:dihydroneopterin aldolase [Sphingobacteriales bacterium]
MATIKQRVILKDIRFFAFHGFYEEEQLLGCEFYVNIETESDVYGNGGDDISNTINYERLFQIASLEMQNTQKLLETVAHSILDQIRHEFLGVKVIKVSIRKMHPPLRGQVDSSIIELSFNR